MRFGVYALQRAHLYLSRPDPYNLYQQCYNAKVMRSAKMYLRRFFDNANKHAAPDAHVGTHLRQKREMLWNTTAFPYPNNYQVEQLRWNCALVLAEKLQLPLH